MKEIVINSLKEFHVRLDYYRKSSWFKFRGQSDTSWKLIPKSGRPPYLNYADLEMFRQWKRRANSQLDRQLNTELELLAVAQHTGLATRLLDWSHNPLAAAFFASVDNLDVDGAIFVYAPNSMRNHEENPFEKKVLEDKVEFFQPTDSSKRIVNQFGYFSNHNPPTMPLNDLTKDGHLERMIIKSNIKKELIHMLNQFGINYLTLFPDLEGLSKHLCWFAENYDYWDRNIADSFLQD